MNMKKIFNIITILLLTVFTTSCLDSNLEDLDTYKGKDIIGIAGVYHRYYGSQTIPGSGEQQVLQSALSYDNFQADAETGTSSFERKGRNDRTPEPSAQRTPTPLPLSAGKIEAISTGASAAERTQRRTECQRTAFGRIMAGTDRLHQPMRSRLQPTLTQTVPTARPERHPFLPTRQSRIQIHRDSLPAGTHPKHDVQKTSTDYRTHGQIPVSRTIRSIYSGSLKETIQGGKAEITQHLLNHRTYTFGYQLITYAQEYHNYTPITASDSCSFSNFARNKETKTLHV